MTLPFHVTPLSLLTPYTPSSGIPRTSTRFRHSSPGLRRSPAFPSLPWVNRPQIPLNPESGCVISINPPYRPTRSKIMSTIAPGRPDGYTATGYAP